MKMKPEDVHYSMPMFAVAKFNIGDRFREKGRGYKPIWEITSRTYNTYKGQAYYDLVSIRINTGDKLLNISEDTLIHYYIKIDN